MTAGLENCDGAGGNIDRSDTPHPGDVVLDDMGVELRAFGNRRSGADQTIGRGAPVHDGEIGRPGTTRRQRSPRPGRLNLETADVLRRRRRHRCDQERDQQASNAEADLFHPPLRNSDSDPEPNDRAAVQQSIQDPN